MPKSQNNHVKPTKEELEEKQKQILEEAEKLANEQPEKETPEEIVDEPAVPDEDEPSEPEKTPQDEEPVETPEEPEKEEALKKKLSASARENQKIYAKNRVINKALSEAEEIPEPTEEELTTEYKDWEDMSEVERNLAKETLVSKRWRLKIKEASDQASKIEKWNDSVDEFTDNPKTLIDTPDLEGKTDAFREFAKNEQHNSVPFNILVSAFLHEQSAGRTPNKGSMFPTGSGGPNIKDKPKSDKISLEDSRRLRETDYPKWKELMAQGKIDISV